MGLLSEGSPLSWEETQALADHVRRHGVLQFINLYRKLKDRTNDGLKWGDEIEYTLLHMDDTRRRARLVLRAAELLPVLQAAEDRDEPGRISAWRPEYAAYMLEGTPSAPYGNMMAHFNIVEMNMRQRREEAEALLHEGEIMLSITGFPRLGCPGFTHPETSPDTTGGASRSRYFPAAAIFGGHPRFATLTRNIRMRRKEKVCMNVPVFKDKNTQDPFLEDFGNDEESRLASRANHIYMDAMGFGMGLSCLQVTFQASNIQEAMLLYDQLTPICPVVLALSAACPIFRGVLSDVDSRWDIISASVDCRTRQERGLVPQSEESGSYRIFKSRYSSVSMYMSPGSHKYNDVPIVHDPRVLEQLCEAGVPPLLAKHVAHLFIRDTVSLFSEKVNQDDEVDVDHFENIQSTNWQSMRFKPPPPNSSIGWRVEFRPTEVQLTDFENAAYVSFVVLLSRAILSLDLNFLIPISKVDENMTEAQKRDACRQGKFWFRTDVATKHTPSHVHSKCGVSCVANSKSCPRWVDPSLRDCHCLPMSVNEIINGKPGVFPGLIALINTYLDSMEVDVDSMCTIQNYLKLIQRRAQGDCMTAARWIRSFVDQHPAYQHDSLINDEVCYDLCAAAHRITKGEDHAPQLLGKHQTKTRVHIPNAVAKAVDKQTNYVHK